MPERQILHGAVPESGSESEGELPRSLEKAETESGEDDGPDRDCFDLLLQDQH